MAGCWLSRSPWAEAALANHLAFSSRLQAAAQQLHASAAVWAEASSQGCWRELQELPAVQRHLAACAQLYAAASVVR